MRRLPALAIALILVAVVAWVVFRDRRETSPNGSSPIAATQDPETRIAQGKAPTKKINAQLSDGKPGPARAFADGQLLWHGKWGSEPGEFGRRRDPESNPEAPMAIAAGAHGQFTIVDQINRRVQRFKDGKPVAQIQTGGDTAQDLTSGPGGSTVLLDRLADKNVQVYGPDGKLSNETPIVGKNVPEGGGVTGVFADDDGIYVEREHGVVVRIADGQGNADPDRPELPGRPTRDGKLWVSASLVDRAGGTVAVHAVDRATGQPAWQQEIRFAAPILHLLLLDSDRNGMVYLAADMGNESTAPPFVILDESVGVARLGAGGAPRGMMQLPAFPTADESFRPLTVDDDGTIYAMVPGPDGVDVIGYRFP